jgi:hypothetical protein
MDRTSRITHFELKSSSDVGGCQQIFLQYERHRGAVVLGDVSELVVRLDRVILAVAFCNGQVRPIFAPPSQTPSR